MNKKDIVITLLAVSNVGFIWAGITINKELKRKDASFKKVWEMGSYLADFIEKKDIELDEFDMIAFRNLTEVDG